MDSSEIFLHLEQNVLKKLEQTETSDGDSIIHIAVNEEVKVWSLKQKNTENDDCSETTNKTPEGSTDFLYLSLDCILLQVQIKCPRFIQQETKLHEQNQQQGKSC